MGSGKRPVYTCIRSAAAVAQTCRNWWQHRAAAAQRQQRSGVGSAESAVQGLWKQQRSGGCAGFGSAAAAELGVGSGSTAAAARVDIQQCRALSAAAQLGSEGVCSSGSAASAEQGIVSCSAAVSSQGSGSAARQRRAAAAAEQLDSASPAQRRLRIRVEIGGSVVQRQRSGELGSAGRCQRQHSSAVVQDVGSGSAARQRRALVASA